eukprot:4602299-Pyramimonas_sp.AAC.1
MLWPADAPVLSIGRIRINSVVSANSCLRPLRGTDCGLAEVDEAGGPGELDRTAGPSLVAGR